MPFKRRTWLAGTQKVHMNRLVTWFALLALITGCTPPLFATAAPGLSQATPARASTASALASPAPTYTATLQALPSAGPAPTPVNNHFGVFVSREDVAAGSDFVSAARELGAGWVRINVDLGVSSPDYTRYLDNGINVILMISNRDPANAIQNAGSLKDWPMAGFPFQSKEKYQQDLRSFLQPSLPYLAQGRQVWVQAENEAEDVTLDPKELYWRGTDDEYLAQLQGLYEAVKSLDARLPVVLTSFASASLDALTDAKSSKHKEAVDHVARLLIQGKYDAVDLHFYGCAEDIPAKLKAVQALSPAGQKFVWISTENGGPDFRCKSTPMSWKDNLPAFEQEQAKEVPLRLSACAANGGEVCLWFSLFDLKKASDTFSHLGLLDQDSNPARKKPAYDAYQTFLRKLK